MNQLAKFNFLLLITFLLVSCSKSDLEFEDQYERSLRKWEDFKRESQNSYSYSTYSGSWTGWSSEMTITIENGKIEQVSYIVPSIAPAKRPENGWTKESFIEAMRKKGYSEEELKKVEEQRVWEKMEWTEDKSNLGSHGDYYLLTLDDVYRLAKENWLVKSKGVTNYLETEHDGLISKVGKVEENCADDCFIGVQISAIEKK